MLSNITFYDFCSFWSITVNIMDKQWFFYIYICCVIATRRLDVCCMHSRWLLQYICNCISVDWRPMSILHIQRSFNQLVVRLYGGGGGGGVSVELGYGSGRYCIQSPGPLSPRCPLSPPFMCEKRQFWSWCHIRETMTSVNCLYVQNETLFHHQRLH